MSVPAEAAPGHPAHEAILHHLQGGHGGAAAAAGQDAKGQVSESQGDRILPAQALQRAE